MPAQTTAITTRAGGVARAPGALNRDVRALARAAHVYRRRSEAAKLFVKERSPLNMSRRIVYNKTTLKNVLISRQDDAGNVSAGDKAIITKLFNSREIYRLCTQYYLASQTLVAHQLFHLRKLGMSHEMALAHVTGNHSKMVKRLVCMQSSPHSDFLRSMMKIFYNHDYSYDLYKITQTPEFLAGFDTLTFVNLVLSGFVNCHTNSLVNKAMLFMISMFAAVRIQREGVTPAVAFQDILDSQASCETMLFPSQIPSV